MAIKKQGRGAAQVHVIEGDLVYRNLQDIRDVLLASQSKTLRISLDQVNDFDLAGVQLLYAFCHEGAAGNRKVVLVPGSFGPRLQKMLSFAGLPPLTCLEETSDA